MTATENRAAAPLPFWTIGKDALCVRLGCTEEGLAAADAKTRLEIHGPNADAPARRDHLVFVILRRLCEPLCLILLVAAALAVGTGDQIGGAIIVAILMLSIGLDTLQEHRALKAAELLRRSVALKAEARRDGRFVEVDVEAVVPGDVVRLREICSRSIAP